MAISVCACADPKPGYEWVNVVTDSEGTLNKDLLTVNRYFVSGDDEKFEEAVENMKQHTIEALDASKSMQVPGNLEYAKEEYEKGLEDLNKASDEYLKAIEIKNQASHQEYMNQIDIAVEYVHSSADHRKTGMDELIDNY